MIENLPLFISGMALVTALYDITSRRVDAWRFLKLQHQEQIRALKAETKRNIDIIKELEKEDLKGPVLQNPAIRKLISGLKRTETAKVSRELDELLGRRLKKMVKTASSKKPGAPNPVQVFYAIKITAIKIEELKARAVLAAKPAPHATRTILSRRIPLLRRKLDLIADALSPIPEGILAPSAAVRKAKTRPTPTPALRRA
jgi:hypothetical protein